MNISLKTKYFIMSLKCLLLFLSSTLEVDMGNLS